MQNWVPRLARSHPALDDGPADAMVASGLTPVLVYTLGDGGAVLMAINRLMMPVRHWWCLPPRCHWWRSCCVISRNGWLMVVVVTPDVSSRGGTVGVASMLHPPECVGRRWCDVDVGPSANHRRQCQTTVEGRGCTGGLYVPLPGTIKENELLVNYIKEGQLSVKGS